MMRLCWVSMTIFALLALKGCVAEERRVSSVTPNVGSLFGGTRMTISGTGFSKNFLNIGSDNIGNTIYLVSATKEFVCDLHQDGCTRDQITCYTRPMPSDRYYVRVYVDGLPLALDAHCGHATGQSNRCSFYPQGKYTPDIDEVQTPYGYPDALTTVRGKLFTDKYGTNVEKGSNGVDAKFVRVWLNDRDCSLVFDDNADNFYGLTLDSETSKTGTMSCKPQGTLVGHRNQTFILDGPYGRSNIDLKTLKVGRENVIYMMQTYAPITSISHQTGSEEGGTPLVISGKFFDNTSAPVKVMVGDEECTDPVISRERDHTSTITCKTPPKHTPKGFKGNRGVYTEIWTGDDSSVDLSAWEISNRTDAPSNTTHSQDFLYLEPNDGDNDYDRYVTRTRGFFIAPQESRFQFLLQSDDGATLYVSEDGDPENKVEAAVNVNANWGNLFNAAKSPEYNFTKDQVVYIEVVHTEFTGRSGVKLGVHMKDTPYNARHSGQVYNEKSFITTTSDVKNEIQELLLNNVPTGNSRQEKQVFTLTSSSLGAQEESSFQIEILGLRSVIIPADANEATITDALNKMALIDRRDSGADLDDTFQVKDISDTSGGVVRSFRVTFPEHKGSYGEMKVYTAPGSAENLQISTSVEQEGKSSGMYLNLQQDNSISPAVAYSTINANKVKNAVTIMNGVRCPIHLVKPTVYSFFQDYETTTTHSESGTRTSEVPAFCGSTSSKNPGFIYSAGQRELPDGGNEWKTGIKSARTPIMCFAFHGIITERLWLLYAYNGESSVIASNLDLHMYMDEYNVNADGYLQEVNKDGKDWRYRCINVLDLVQGVHDFITSIEVLEARIYNAAENSNIDPLYVDLVSFTSKVPSPSSSITVDASKNSYEMISLITNQRMIPTQWFLDEATVTSNSSYGITNFKVDMSVINCEKNIQLMKVAFATVTQTNSQTSSAYEGLANSEVVVRSVERASGPIGGTMSFTWGGYSLSGLDTNIEAHHLAGAITELSDSAHDFGQVQVTRSGTCAGYTWIIEHSGKGGDHPDLQFAGTSNLVPDSAAVSAMTFQNGGVFYEAIQADMLISGHWDTPQVQVTINNVLSQCETDCGFTWTSDATPTLTAASPASGTPGQSLTLTGTGFSTESTENEVMIGGAECAVTVATETSLTCTLGEGPAGTHPIVLTVTTKGLARHEGGSYSFEYPFSVLSISENTGSLAGGRIITVGGTGFSTETVIKIGNNVCEIQGDIEYDSITCEVPKGDTLGAVAVTGTNGALPTETGPNFTYEAPAGTITNVDVTTAAVEGGTAAVITGTGFRDSGSQMITVGDAEANITSYSQTKIDVVWPANGKGTYSIRLKDGDDGYADNGGFQVTYSLIVNNIYPTSGSAMGGSVLTITGSGFSTTPELNNIMFGETECRVLTAESTEVTCELGFASKVHKITNQGFSEAIGSTGYAFLPQFSFIQQGEMVSFEWSTPEHIQDIGYRVAETYNMSSEMDMTDGFSSGSERIRNGKMDYVVWNGRTLSERPYRPYHFWSGYVNSDENIFFFGKFELRDRQTDDLLYLKYKIGDEEADYTASGGNPASGACTDNTPPVSGCLDLGNTDNQAHFNFAPRMCQTPKITGISPSELMATEEIVITGEGFSTTCDNEVFLEKDLHRIPCLIQSSSATEIRCKVDPNCFSMPVGIPMSVDVRVGNLGWAVHAQEGGKHHRAVILQPHVSGISLSTGSTTGGLQSTITGGNFMYNSDNVCTSSRKRRSAAGDAIQNSGGVYSYSLSIPGCSDVKILGPTTIECTLAASSSAVNLLPTVTTLTGTFTSGCTTQGACTFTPNQDLNPKVTSVANHPITGSGQKLTISGSLFGSNEGAVSVTVGDSVCTISDFSSTEIKCEVDEPVAGTHALAVLVNGVGFATIDPGHSQIGITGSVSSISPNPVGVGGGLGITLSGFGFHPDDTAVTINGEACLVTAVSFTEISCINPALAQGTYNAVVATGGHSLSHSIEYGDSGTPSVNSITPNMGAGGDTIDIAGSNFGNVQGDVTVSVGSETCTITAFSDTSISCTLPHQVAGATSLKVLVAGNGLAVASVAGALDFTYKLEFGSITPSTGSTGGGQTVAIAGSGFDPQGTSVTICGSACAISGDVTVTGFSCVTPPDLTNTGAACDAVVTLANGQTKTLATKYNYQTMATISGVSPRDAGTGGGKSITITGSGFGNDANDVTVTIASAMCNITAIKDTEIICDTGEHKPAEKTKVEVQLASSGIAYQGNNADFEYIDMWSSVFTWGGNPLPVAGDLVVIPEDMTVRLDVDTPVFKVLLINGGTVQFDGNDRTLRAEIIFIAEGGTLQVGTEAEPYPVDSTAHIELHGHVRSKELPIYGTKNIALRQGYLDMHGQSKGQSWTVLDQTANAGDDEIVLQGDISLWKPGDEIAIASTGHHHSQAQNEQRTIASVTGQRVTLTEALSYKHLGENVPLGGTGKVLAARAEVGILTRNVKFTGTDNEEWHDKIEACPQGFNTGEFATQTCFNGRFGEEIGSEQFGGIILVHSPQKAANESEIVSFMRLSNVEMTNVGQAFRLGRYAVHYHVNGDMTGSYVKECAIHKSFNRAVNIHATNHVLVEGNVAFDIMGGVFFLEDGVEMYNTIRKNLVIFSKSSTSLQNDDITPAAFWVTNAYNTITDNHAAGGTHFGFWYRMHEFPDGPSFSPDFRPRRVPLLEFARNTVHSQGWFGVWIFMVFTPMTLVNVDGSGYSTTPQAAVFDSSTFWNCEKGFESVGGGAFQLKDSLIVNSEVAGVEIKLILESTPFSETQGPMISGTTIVGRVAALDQEGNDRQNYGVILPQGRGLTLKDMTYVGFNTATSCVYTVANIQGTTITFSGGYTYWASGHTFDTTDCLTAWRWHHDGLIIDLDGSVSGSGVAMTKLLPEHKDIPPSCITGTDSGSKNIGRGPGGGAQCGPDTDFHRFAFNNYLPSSLEGKNVSFTNRYGTQLAYYADKSTTHPLGWRALILSNEEYVMEFVNAGQITNLTYSGIFYDYAPDQWNIMKHQFYQNPDRFTITDVGDRSMSVNALSVGSNRYGDWHIPLPSLNDEDRQVYESGYLIDGEREMPYDENTTVVYNDIVDRAAQLKVYRCFYDDCVEPLPFNEAPVPKNRASDYVIWSNNSIWSHDNNGVARANKETGNPADTDLPDGTATEIIIDKGTWVVLTASPGHSFKEITVYGTLEFEWALPLSRKRGTPEPRTIEFICTHILLAGGHIFIGWEDKPMLNNVIISLTGNQHTEDKVIQNGPNMGAKAIGVFGGLEVHGKETVLSWTKLSTNALAGLREIRLDRSVSVADSGWQVGDDIVIAGTGSAPGETEVHRIKSFNTRSNAIILEDALKYNHQGETVLQLEDGTTVEIAAEVGHLSRNIKIQGVNSDAGTDQDMFQTGFGGRLIVGQFNTVNEEGELEIYTGYARLKNVEFKYMGQEGWNEFYDPRYAVAFLNTGDVTDIKPSEVTNCTMWYNFNSALGVFGSYNMNITGNVAYRTVGSGMIIWETGHLVQNNLVLASTYPGMFNGRVEQRDQWVAGFELNEAADIRLVGNVAADHERGGFRVDGEVCSEPRQWFDNVAHTGMAGVFQLPDQRDGVAPCGRIAGFTSYHHFDWGLYLQSFGSLELEDNIVMENTVGSFSFVYGPSSTGHQFADKYVSVKDSTYIGATARFDCASLDRVFESAEFNTLLELSASSRSWRIDRKGMSGLSLATFSQASTSSPRKPMNNIMSYHAINGKTTIKDTTFYNYGEGCSGSRDYAITTTSANDDGIHPAYLSGTKAVNVDEQSKFYNHRPNLGKINPADCVDMDCDGLKKVILKDETGDLLGEGVTMISQSEWEWDGDRRRGLGDYRVPKVLQTDLNGHRIDINAIAQERGIIRNSGCSLQESSQCWKCQNMDHEMLHLESLDDDSETRRISPVAIQGPLPQPDYSSVFCSGTADQPCYLDLANGPQDHGWCMGYTCQKRLSLFPIVLSPGKAYHVVFTGTTPQNLRLHWLNTDDTQSAVVGIWFSQPYRLDVYSGDTYVPPTNMDPNYGPNDLRLLRPQTDSQYLPVVDTDPAGTNYYDRNEQFLYVTLRGSVPVTIRTAELIFVTFDVPMLTVDQFFGEEIITNFANFFDIPSDKIRIATVVKESRRKRQDTLQITVHIGNDPHNLTDVDPSDLTSEQLNDIAARILQTYQLDELDDVLQLEILSFSIVEPPPGSDTETWRVMAELGTNPTITAMIPTAMEFERELVSLHEGAAFSTQPVLRMKDANGDVNSQLGTIASPWEVTATLFAVQSDWGQAALIGSQTVQYKDGQFAFSDLGVSHSGNYKVTFTVSSPAEASHFSLDSQEISVAERDLAAGIVSQPEMVTVDQEFNVTLEIVDAVTGEKVEDIAWKGHTWEVSVSLYMPDMYEGVLSSPVQTVTVDSASGEAVFNDISITAYGRYFLAFDFMSDPSDFKFNAPADMAVDVYPKGYENPAREVLHHIIIKFDGDYDTVVGNMEKYFNAAVYNKLWYEYIEVAFSNFDSSSGSILAAFDVAGSRDSVDSMVDSLWEKVQDGYTVEFNGHMITTTGDMWVDGENLKEEKRSMHVALIVVIVILAIALVGTIVGFIIYKYYKSKNGKDNFKLEKREPTAKRRKTGQVTDDYYHTMGVPDNRSSSSLSSDSQDNNEEKPIVAAIPPKSTNFDFLNVRPKTSYRPPGALPPLQHRGTANPDSRPVSSTHLDIAVVANSPNGGMPRVDTPEN